MDMQAGGQNLHRAQIAGRTPPGWAQSGRAHSGRWRPPLRHAVSGLPHGLPLAQTPPGMSCPRCREHPRMFPHTSSSPPAARKRMRCQSREHHQDTPAAVEAFRSSCVLRQALCTVSAEAYWRSLQLKKQPAVLQTSLWAPIAACRDDNKCAAASLLQTMFWQYPYIAPQGSSFLKIFDVPGRGAHLGGRPHASLHGVVHDMRWGLPPLLLGGAAIDRGDGLAHLAGGLWRK